MGGRGLRFSPGARCRDCAAFSHGFVFGIAGSVASGNQEHRMHRSVVDVNPALMARGRAELRKRR